MNPGITSSTSLKVVTTNATVACDRKNQLHFDWIKGLFHDMEHIYYTAKVMGNLNLGRAWLQG